MKKHYVLPLACLAIMPISSAFAKQKRPNILFVMSDDHTAQAVGVYGSILAPLNPTPTIDEIANEGMIFQNAFCTNSISTPSRANIITGQYSQTNGVLDLDDALDASKEYLPMEMKKLGYQTAMIGKWHLHVVPSAFDYYNVFYEQGQYFDPVLYESGCKDSLFYSYRGKRGMMPGTKHKGYCSDIVTDITLNWFKNIRDKNKPFFVMHHFKAPHDMWDYAPRYEDYLKDVEIPEPSSLYNDKNIGSKCTRGEDHSLESMIGSSIGRRNKNRSLGQAFGLDEKLSEKEFKHQAYQMYLKKYLRCVKGVDDNLKRIIDYLKKENLYDNTIIIYTGDQGIFLGEKDYYDKRWMYEESMRMPFVIRYPKEIKAGSKSKTIINNVDFAPTMITLAGGKVPSYMQGKSFEEILKGNEHPVGWENETYYRYWMHMIHHYNPAHFGIRTDRYKLIFFYALDYTNRAKRFPLSRVQTPVGWEFYDLQKDPNEMHNEANNPRYADVIRQLKLKLAKLRHEYNEEDEAYPKIQKAIDEHWDDIPVE